MKTFHLATESGKNARVPIGRTASTKLKTIQLTADKEETFTEMVHRGDAPEEGITPEALVSGDPEIDMEHVGMILSGATRGYRKAGDKELVGDFQKFVTTYLPDGTEKEKTAHSPKKANVDDTVPVKMGKRIPVAEAFSRFVFHNHYALTHDDGVKYEFLHSIAKDLHEKGEMAALGAGAKGVAPLVFLEGGTPYRAFLYGECEGDKYRLLVLVTRMELKLPEGRTPMGTATTAASAEADSAASSTAPAENAETSSEAPAKPAKKAKKTNPAQAQTPAAEESAVQTTSA